MTTLNLVDIIVNSGPISGWVVILSPVNNINKKEIMFSGLMIFFSVLLLIIFMRSGKRVAWQEAIILICASVVGLAGRYFIR